MPTMTTETKPTTPPAQATARAFDYLRVSGAGQTRTDYDPDGLSIGAQREASLDKAHQLNAEIVREFSDPGRSAYVDLHKRTGFLTMLDELKRCNADEVTRVHYVIVWSLSRWARNQRDHWLTRELVREAGAQLISVSEPMIGDDSAAAFFTESIIAAKNQYESMQTSENVKRSIYRKAKNGGTYGWTRLGYLNDVDKLPDGRRVSIAIPDPDRCHFLTLAFQLYATGEYSVSSLVRELYRLGLRSRPRTQRPPQQVNTTSLQRILRDAYYAGWIVYKRGKPDEETFRGLHQPLVDQETFDRVQSLLDEKRTAQERNQTRRHYLRGTVFCGDCGHRLVYGLSRSKSGKRYPYYFCVSRTRGSACTMHTSIAPQLIETAIQRYYRERPVQLKPADVAKRTEAIEALAAVSEQAVEQIRTAKTELIAKLKAQQSRLLRLHLEEGDDVSPDAFRDERARMQSEITAAEQSLAETEQRLTFETEHFKLALELAEDVAQVYAKAADSTKRSLNQAFFKRLFVLPEWDDDGNLSANIAEAELTEPYVLLLADDLALGVLAEVEAITAAAAQRNAAEASESQIDVPKPLAARCSYFDQMAEGEGFEPSSEESPPKRFSRPPHSTALPPLRDDAAKASRSATAARRRSRSTALRTPPPAAPRQPRADGSGAARRGRRARCRRRRLWGRSRQTPRAARGPGRSRRRTSRRAQASRRGRYRAPASRRPRGRPRAAPAPRRAPWGPGAVRARCGPCR
jgi:site-specific DNA recombinase